MASKTLGEALLAVQSEIPTLQKNAINPHFKNAYISLDELVEQVLPVLNKHGLVLIQEPTSIYTAEDTPMPGLKTTLLFAGTGEFRESTMPLMLAKDDPQGQGSAITYARRYALMGILSLVADVDDDAQSTRPAPTKASKPAGSNTPVTTSSPAL